MEKLPAQMTVVGISKPGGPEVLLPETRAVPVPGPGEILVKVMAAGVNRPDVAQRSGAYPPPPGASDLPGLEIAGEVVALGAGATKHKLGDNRTINYKTEDVVAVVKAETNNAGANLILDMVAGDYVDRNYDAAAVDGRIVQIATLNGPKVTVNIARVMVKRLTHTGSTLRPRTNADKAAMVAAIEAKLIPLLREGRVKRLMDSSFPLEKAANAHRRMETSAHIGKIVLAV